MSSSGVAEDVRPEARSGEGAGMPVAMEAERAVLGCILGNPTLAMGEVVQHVGEEAFFVGAHRDLFLVLRDMMAEGRAIDLVTVGEELKARDLLEKVGGMPNVAAMWTETPDHHNLRWYLDVVKERWFRRRVLAGMMKVREAVFDLDSDVEGFLNQVEAEICALRNTDAKGALPARVYVHEALERIEHAYHNRGKVTLGYATGFTELDRMTMGLQRQQVVIIAARTSHGKSMLINQILEHQCVQEKVPAVVFSLEDSGERYMRRMLMRRAGVNAYRAMDGFLKRQDFARVTESADDLAKAPLFVDEAAGMNILEIRSRARLLKQKHDIKVVAVDYLQLVSGVTKQALANRALEIAEVSRGLRAMAKELDVCVIAAAQLNRDAEDHSVPKLRHLRESGSIEQDADVVLILHRPGKDNSKVDDDHAILRVAKIKDGGVGDINLTWDREVVRFGNELDDEGHERRLYN